MSVNTKHFFEFEDFRLCAEDPSLWRGDELVQVSPKALEMLVVLVQKKGEIVSREELIETLWKDTFVEEGNINYTVSLLRKVFENKELIKTVPRRGYRFTAEVRDGARSGAAILESETTPVRRTAAPLMTWAFGVVLLIGILFVSAFAYLWKPDIVEIPATDAKTQTSEAMRTYMLGKMILESRSADNRSERAIDEFQRAIALDPTLAIAYAGLAEGFASAANRIPYPESTVTVAKARTAAEKALALEPNLAEGYLIRGWIRRNIDWDWSGAEADFRRSIELSPKNATAHQRLAQTLAITGQFDEALAESKIAYDLDPVSESILTSRIPVLEARGDYEEGLKESEAFMRENKNSNQAARAYATFLLHAGNYQKVVEIGEPALVRQSNQTPFAWLSLLAAAYHAMNEGEKSAILISRLEEMSQTDTKALYSLAMNYAEQGRIDEAVRAIQRCYETREERMAWLNVEPRFENLRSDDRFKALLAKMKFR